MSGRAPARSGERRDPEAAGKQGAAGAGGLGAQFPRSQDVGLGVGVGAMMKTSALGNRSNGGGGAH